MSFRTHGIALLILPLLLGFATASLASNEKVTVVVGQSVTRTVESPISTVSVADANIADVVVAGPKQLLINGKAIGLTTLVVWDELNQSTIFDIVVRGPFSDQKIELRVKLAEVNRSRMSEVGMDILFRYQGGNEWDAGTFGGPVSTPSIPLSMFDGIPTEDVTGALRWMAGGANIQTMIRALEAEGAIRVLAEPNVVAASGEEANFLSGGEIPVPIASAGTQGGSTVTIEWKEFGVKVDFVPTIVDDGVINLNLDTEVSSLDFSNGIEISGFRVPALRARKGRTTVELRDQETLVIGGLIMEEESTLKTKIPLLGHIPLLGRLFSNTKKTKTTTELMLVVSPAITRALPPNTKLQLPTLNGRSSLDLGKDIGTQPKSGLEPAGSAATPPKPEASAPQPEESVAESTPVRPVSRFDDPVGH